jgi:hypothetical protein
MQSCRIPNSPNSRNLKLANSLSLLTRLYKTTTGSIGFWLTSTNKSMRSTEFSNLTMTVKLVRLEIYRTFSGQIFRVLSCQLFWCRNWLQISWANMKVGFITQALTRSNTRFGPSSTKNTRQKSNFWRHFQSKPRLTKPSKKLKTKAREAYFRSFTTTSQTRTSLRRKINGSKNRFPAGSTIANVSSLFLTLLILSGTSTLSRILKTKTTITFFRS